MEFTEQDRDALYQTWMSQKSRMRITQMEFSKKLGMNQLDFSRVLKGDPINHVIHQSLLSIAAFRA